MSPMMGGMTAMPDAPMMAGFLMLCLLAAGFVFVGVIALVIWFVRKQRP